MFARVSSKGQVTIPADLRKALNIAAGSQVRFVLENEEIRILPAKEGIESLRGTIKVPEVQDFKAIRQRVMEERSSGEDKNY